MRFVGNIYLRAFTPYTLHQILMYIRLIRNQPKGSAITGRLVIDGRWFCNTLERKGYEILALCYPVRVTHSPKFKRLLPLVCGVLQTEAKRREAKGERQGIRFHRGSKPEHSTGCILVLGDNINNNHNNIKPTTFRGNQLPAAARNYTSVERPGVLIGAQVVETSCPSCCNNKPIGTRTSADVENQLTQLLLQAQNAHEEIILEVTDFRPGTEYGYNTPCPPELQKP